MSSRTSLKFLLGAFSVTLMAALAVKGFDKGSSDLRRFSNPKTESLKPIHEIMVRTHKLLPHFTVALKNLAEEPIENGSRFTLEARIETTQPISSLNYEWVLPPGVELANGYGQSGTLTNLTSKVGSVFRTEFINLRDENLQIHLRVWTGDGSSRMLLTSQFNTVDQDKIDQEQKELVERQNEYLLGHPELLKKFK